MAPHICSLTGEGSLVLLEMRPMPFPKPPAIHIQLKKEGQMQFVFIRFGRVACLAQLDKLVNRLSHSTEHGSHEFDAKFIDCLPGFKRCKSRITLSSLELSDRIARCGSTGTLGCTPFCRLILSSMRALCWLSSQSTVSISAA